MRLLESLDSFIQSSEMIRKPYIVLVAEPDPVTSHAIAEMLKVRGYAVTSVTELASSLRALDTVLFDALIVPVATYQAAADLSLIQAAKEKQPMIKIIGISDPADGVASGHAAGLDGVLHKPITLQQVENSLQQLIGGRISE